MPVLSIVFRNNNGLENYWDYTSSHAGRAGSGYINNYTGNLVWVHSDIGFSGNRMPVAISHIYNANDSADNLFGMGNGWRTNYNQRVYYWDHEDADEDYYVWEDADGTSHYFRQDGTIAGRYVDEDGLELELTTTGSGAEPYCISDKYGNSSYFDDQGRLTKQSNNQTSQSHITITYSTTSDYFINTITDGAGRVYSFEYPGDLLSRISYKGSGSDSITHVSFGYTGSNLTSITNADGEKVYYTYVDNSDDSSKNLIETAMDIDGYQISYTYTTLSEGKPARINSVNETDTKGTSNTSDDVAGGAGFDQRFRHYLHRLCPSGKKHYCQPI